MSIDKKTEAAEIGKEVDEAVKAFCLAYLPRHKLNFYALSHTLWTLIDYVYAKEQIFDQHVTHREVETRDNLINAMCKVFKVKEIPLADKRRVMHNLCKPGLHMVEQALAESMKGGD